MAEEMMDLTNKEKLRRIVRCFSKQCAVFVLLMGVLIGLYVVALHYVKLKRDIDNIIQDNYNIVFQIDEVNVEENTLSLEGWAFRLNKDALNGDMELWLYDLQEAEIVYPDITEYARRTDVNEYFACEYNYSNCGIKTNFSGEKFVLANKNYEVLVADINGARVYQTGNYVCNGKLLYCLPEEYCELEVAETDIEQIVNTGILRVYRPDFGMYVYQYEGALYWIAEPSYGFVDGDTFVQFQMNTTQIEKLPEYRLANNWFWSNISFSFKSKELTECNTGKYRVAKYELPTDYSITKIWTGNYIDGWIWKQNFWPWYDFSN